ncbi:MAG: hypothetical protein O9262_15555 [Cyclobacteriaceae bacterium]|nr:hypothetical protein [Cyclobacteriaceae bacterium]
MRMTNEQYSLLAGFFQLIIATTYALICISNYSFDWLDYEFAQDLSKSELLKINGDRTYDPELTWGLAGFNAIMFIVYWIIWKEDKIAKKPDFKSDTFSIGIIPFLFALFLYFMVDYRNLLVLVITGIYAAINIALYMGYEISNRQQNKDKS